MAPPRPDRAPRMIYISSISTDLSAEKKTVGGDELLNDGVVSNERARVYD